MANDVVAGKLKVIPAKQSKKLVIFDWIAAHFEAGHTYSENDVNSIIGRLHDDFATLRRGLYDAHFVDRSESLYWRTIGDEDLAIVDDDAAL